MTRLLFVYRFCTLGGVETILKLRLAELPKLGIEPYALFLRDAGGSRAFTGLKDRIFMGATRDSLPRLLNDLRIDVLSSVDTFEVFGWLDVRAPYPRCSFLELHSTYEATLRELSRQEGLLPDAIVVPSEYQAGHVRPFLPQDLASVPPVFVVPNAIAAEDFPAASRWEGGEGPQIVAWIGRIDPLKNWSGFLDLAAALSDRSGTEFWMIGGAFSERDARRSLRHQMAKRGLASRFRWWPAIRHDRMPSLYRHVAESGGVTVLTTRNESFGLVALESQAAGCPLVAPAVGAIPEVVRDGATAFLYPSGKTRKAALQVRELLDDAELRRRTGLLGAEHARARFGPEATLPALVEAVRRTLSSPSQPPKRSV